jgi:hypothetical protein
MKALSAASLYKTEILIHGGDIIGKYIIPFFRSRDCIETEIMGSKRIFKCDAQAWNTVIQAAEAEISRIGAYAFYTTRDEWAELTEKPDKMAEIFVSLAEKRLRSWVEIAEQKLKPLNIKFFLNIGNDDYQSVSRVIEDSSYVVFPNKKIVMLDDEHELLSLSNTNITPWKCEGDLQEKDLLKTLQELSSKLQYPEKAVFNLHCPPLNTKLDVAPKLDNKLRPVLLPGGDPEMVHVGCSAVRTIIEHVQPLVGLHGHIHESKAVEKIGRTTCFNPGSEYTVCLLSSLLLNLSRDKVESFMFLSG